MKTFIIILFLFLSSCFQNSFAQTQHEIQLLKAKYQPHQIENQFKFNKNSSSFLEIISSQLFSFYKLLISSQDFNSCSFSPSCSVYAVKSIEKNGFIEGVLNSLDRLMRCHGLAPEHYHADYEKKLLIDEVHNIKYEHAH